MAAAQLGNSSQTRTLDAMSEATYEQLTTYAALALHDDGAFMLAPTSSIMAVRLNR